MAPRTVQILADTSYLLCFGAIGQGTKLMGQAFNNGIGATMTVRHELENIKHRKKPESVKAAARSFIGKHDRVLLTVDLVPSDVTRREQIQTDLGQTPVPRPSRRRGTAGTPASTSSKPIAILEGADAGESEAIAVCERTELPLLINERKGSTYARHLGIPVESAAVTLARLQHSYTNRELFRMARDMAERAGDIGDDVRGPSWFNSAAPRIGPPDASGPTA